MVLDGVVSAAGEEARDGGPFVAVNGVRLDDDRVLRRGKRAVLHVGAELIAPPETAGLAGSARDAGADDRPVPRTVLADELHQRLVLLRTP